MPLPQTSSLRLAWTLGPSLTSDDHSLSIHFSATAWPLQTPADRKLFSEVFPQVDPPPDAPTIARHYEPALAAAARQTAAAHDVAFWLGPDGSILMARTLQQAADAVAFRCGMSIGHPVEIQIESPTHRRQQLDRLQRRQAEQAAAGRLQHARHALDLLQQFESLRQSAPDLPAGQLLRQLAPLDQDQTLHALLMADAAQNPVTGWIVSGTDLLQCDLPLPSPSSASTAPACRKFTWSDEPDPTAGLGSFRSIRRANRTEPSTLLIGAQNGLLQLSPIPPHTPRYFRDTNAWQMGFNSSLILQDLLWAAHGEAGLVGWQLDHPDQPRHTLRLPELQQRSGAPDARPRHLTPLDDARALLALGARLLVLHADGVLTPLPLQPLPAPIIAILNEGETLAILHADGQLLRLHRHTLEPDAPIHAAGPLTAAASLPWMGSARLLLTPRESPLLCIGREDALITRYPSPAHALPLLAAAPGWIAAATPDRRRLLLWRTWDPSAAPLDLPITPHTHHRIADLALL